MPPPRAHPIALLALLVAVVFTLTLPRVPGLDAWVRYTDLEHVLRGEKTVNKFSMVGPLCAAPLHRLGEELGDAIRWTWQFNRVVILLAGAGFWWVLRPVLTAAERCRFLVALLLASMLPHHLMHFGGEPFSSAAAAVGLAAAVVRRAWWGVPLAVAGVINTPGNLGGLALAVLVLAARTRRLRYLLAVPAAAGLVLLENYIHRGDPFRTGYENERGPPTILPFAAATEFGYPLFFGVLSVLFSFGKGLVFFFPLLFLPPPRDRAHPDAAAGVWWVYLVWVAFVAGLVPVYARWWAWYGGWCWGPRFFLFACFPAALVAARRTAAAATMSSPANLLTLAALVLSGWIALAGVAFGLEGQEPYLADGQAFEYVLWYVPECSSLWLPFVRPRPLTAGDTWRAAAVVVGFAYLAAPVVAALARRLPGNLAAVRDAVGRAPWRF